MNSVRNRIREYRKAFHVSQAYLAEAVGCNRYTINAAETGRHRPSLELMQRIADFFGCGLGDLYVSSNSESINNDLYIAEAVLSEDD